MPTTKVTGTKITAVRFTLDEAIDILTQAAIDAGLDVEAPDFGEGEADAERVVIQSADGVSHGFVTEERDLVLILKDEEK